MVRVLIAGGYDTRNLGDYASWLGLQKLLNQEFGHVEFTVLSRHPDDPFADFSGAEMLKNFDFDSRNESEGKFFRGFNIGDDQEHLIRINAALSRVDCLVIGNGRLFLDFAGGYFRGPLQYFALLVVLAKVRGIPVILSSVTLVRLASTWGKAVLRFILSNASLVLVREESSAVVARELLDVADHVFVAPDVALAVRPGDASACEFSKQAHGSIAVNFKGVHESRRTDVGDYSSIAHSLKSLSDLGRPLVFVNQCTYSTDSELTNDAWVAEQIISNLPKEMRRSAIVAPEDLSLSEVLHLYQGCEFLVTERRHGFLLGLTQGCPSALVGTETNSLVVSETLGSDNGVFDSLESALAAARVGRLPRQIPAAADSGLEMYGRLFRQALSRRLP